MADLGSIDFRTPESGIADANERVTRAVAGVGELAVKEREKDILLGFKEQAGNIVDSLESEEVVNQIPAISPTGDPVADAFQRNLRRLKAASEQGNSSQRARAELLLRRELNKAQERYPSLRRALSQEYREFVATDASLYEIDLRDQSLSNYSREAAAQRTAIRNHATELGIPPAVNMDTPEFAQMYLYLAEIDQGKTHNQLVLEANQASTDVSAEQMEAGWQRTMVGKYSSIMDAVQEYAEQADIVARSTREDFTGNPESLQVIADWQNGGKEEALRGIENHIITLETMFLEEESRYGDSPALKRVEKLKDDAIGSLDRLKKAIEAQDPDLMKIWEAEQLLRVNAIRSADHNIDKWLTLTEVMKPMIPILEANLSGEHIVLLDQIATGMTKDVTNFLAEAYTDPVVTGTPTQIRSRLNGQRNVKTTSTYGVPKTGNPREIQKAAVAFQSQLSTYLGPLSSLSDPEVVGEYMLTYTDKIQELRSMGDSPDDAVRIVKESLASDGVIKAIVVANKDPNQRNKMIALGDEAADYWNDDVGHRRHMEPIRELASTYLGNVSLLEALVVDFKESEGRVVLTVDESKIANFDPSLVGFTRERAISKAREAAAQLSDLVTTNVRAWAHIQWLRNPNQTSEQYGDAFTDLDFDAFFGIAKEEDVDTSE